MVAPFLQLVFKNMGSDTRRKYLRPPIFAQADEAIGIAGGMPHAFR